MIDLDTFDFDSCTPESLKADAKVKIRQTLLKTGMEIDMREGSYTDALLSEAAYQVYQAIMLAPDLMAAMVPTEDGGSHLDAFAGIYGLVRGFGSKATAKVQFTGTDKTVIPAGTWVVAATGERYKTLAAVTISAGSATATVEAEDVGSHYNVDAGAITRMQVTLSGVTAVTNAAAAAGGSDTESDRAFYTRLHTMLSAPVASGNVNNYKQWARECSGVGYVAVLPTWNGPGTVKVVLAGEDKLPVGEPIRAATEAHIEKERPIGAQVTVVSATALEIAVAATVTLEVGASESSVRLDMQTALQELFDSLPFGSGATIRYNRVLALLLSLPGVVDCVILTINGGKTNVVLKTEQVPKLTSVEITKGD